MGRWVVLWMFYAFPLMKWVRFVMMSISVTFNFLSNVISKGMNRFHRILSSPTGLFQPVIRPPGVSFSWNVTTREPFCDWWAPRGAVVGCACSSYSLLSVRWFPRFLGAELVAILIASVWFPGWPQAHGDLITHPPPLSSSCCHHGIFSSLSISPSCVLICRGFIWHLSLRYF